MKKFIIGLFIFLVISEAKAQCPDEHVFFLGQSDVTEFLNNYPDCTEIDALWIFHPPSGSPGDAISLAGMENIVSINNLVIQPNGLNIPNACFSFEGFSSLAHIGWFASTAKLCDFEGLDALESINFTWLIGPDFDSMNPYENLPEYNLSFSGLESVQQIDTLLLSHWELNDISPLTDIQISKLLGIGNCTGFSSLSEFNLQNSASLYLELLPELTSLDGIESLTSLGGLVLLEVPNLENILSLSNLHSIVDSIIIRNTAIQDLSVFNNLQLIGGGVSIYNNPNLSVCSFQYLCEHLEILGTVQNNAEGCNSIAEVAEDCGVSAVSGKVYADLNCNGEQDDNEPNIVNNFVFRNTNDPFTTTNILGEYSGWLAQEQGFIMTTSTPVGFSSSLVNISTTNDIQVFENVDLSICPSGEFANIVVSITPYGIEPRPGFSNSYQVCVSNHGSVIVDADVALNLNLVSNIEIVDSDGGTIDGQIIHWNVESLSPFQSECFNVMIYNSPETPLGTIYQLIVQGSNSTVTEIDPSDNHYEYIDVVIGSYDPNDKRVDNEVVNMANVAPDSVITLDYLIRFQNTGTAPAIFIHVIDLLAPHLDVTTLTMINASHDYVLYYDSPNKLDWFFDNIYLPDSTSNEPESHGFIHFKINTFPGMQVGDVIENYASIYFDFNAPIITESAFTKFMLCPDVEIELEVGQLSTQAIGDSYQWHFNGVLISGATEPWLTPSEFGIYSVYVYWEDGCVEAATYSFGNVSVNDHFRDQIKLMPNPAKGMTSIIVPDGDWQVTLLDVNGRQQTHANRIVGNRLDIQLNALSPGIYFVHVQSNDYVVVKKLIVN